MRHIRQRVCAVCTRKASTVYCCNDDAFLCAECDVSAHANPLAARHAAAAAAAAAGREDAAEMAPAAGAAAAAAAAGMAPAAAAAVDPKTKARARLSELVDQTSFRAAMQEATASGLLALVYGGAQVPVTTCPAPHHKCHITSATWRVLTDVHLSPCCRPGAAALPAANVQEAG